ncbi:MAG: IS1595 family transposase [Rhodospirillaceae bacterium]|nr:IS1595 family transposase [Rhodospirillaceae bacterium]
MATILELARLSEDEARAMIEGIRWPNGPECPHCASHNAVRLEGKTTRPGVLKCRDCGKQFTVTVNTIMHRSKVPLSKWLVAFHLMCSSKKGISALQLQRELGLGSYQTAWHMEHRIRYAMASGGLAAPLKGDVEVDETYVGGKPRKGTKGDWKDGKHKPGRGTKKQPVMALVERGGEARTRVIPDVSGATLRTAIQDAVDRDSRILTDEWRGYRGVGKHFARGHQTVSHSAGEYVRGDVSTNTAEAFFALFKRGIVGIFHSVSKQHLHRYAGEFEFRWNHRTVSDHERMKAAIAQTGGKRLTYKPTVGLV